MCFEIVYLTHEILDFTCSDTKMICLFCFCSFEKVCLIFENRFKTKEKENSNCMQQWRIDHCTDV